MPGVVIRRLKKSRSDPCLDVVKLRLQDVLPPLFSQGHTTHPSGTSPAIAHGKVGINIIGVQTDLTARRPNDLADGRKVNSLAFAKFLTGKRVSAYDGYEDQEGANEVVPEPRSSSAINLSIALSDRFIGLEAGPVAIVQNSRLTPITGRQKEVTLENEEIFLRELRLSEAEIESARQVAFVETTAANALTPSPDELPGIVQEVLKYRRELGLGGTNTNEKQSNADNLLSGAGKLPQDQHSTIAELTVDDVAGGVTSGEAGSKIAIREGSLGRGPGRSAQDPAIKPYDEYMTERVVESNSYLATQHLGSLSKMPEEDQPLDLQQDFFFSIMKGVCGHCGKELKHLELTVLFRYKLLHKDDPFIFDEEHFCCEEFQKELEKLLFSRGVKNAVKDIRRSQIARMGSVSSRSVDKNRSKKNHGHGRGSRQGTDQLGELDTIARLLEEDSDSSSSGSDSNDDEADGKAEASSMRGKFKNRLKSNAAGRLTAKSIGGARSIVAGSGGTVGGRGSVTRVIKGRSTVSRDGRGGFMASSGDVPGSSKFSEKESLYTVDQLRSSGSDSRPTCYSLKSTPDELDTRYRGNSISWSLSSRVCLKTGWTLRRPQSSVAETLYLTEKILDVDVDMPEIHRAVHAETRYWPLFPACFVHWPDDDLVSPYNGAPDATNFYPYLDGSTACTTVEYAPGLSIVVVLPKSTDAGATSTGRPSCPIGAIFDTSSWGALINPDWGASILLSPKHVSVTLPPMETGEATKTVSWKKLVRNAANPDMKKTQKLNDEAELDIRAPSEINYLLKNEAMRMEMNCGFRRVKRAYSSPSENGTKAFLADLDLRHHQAKKHLSTLDSLLRAADLNKVASEAAGDSSRSRRHRKQPPIKPTPRLLVR